MVRWIYRCADLHPGCGFGAVAVAYGDAVAAALGHLAEGHAGTPAAAEAVARAVVRHGGAPAPAGPAGR